MKQITTSFNQLRKAILVLVLIINIIPEILSQDYDVNRFEKYSKWETGFSTGWSTSLDSETDNINGNYHSIYFNKYLSDNWGYGTGVNISSYNEASDFYISIPLKGVFRFKVDKNSFYDGDDLLTSILFAIIKHGLPLDYNFSAGISTGYISPEPERKVFYRHKVEVDKIFSLSANLGFKMIKKIGCMGLFFATDLQIHLTNNFVETGNDYLKLKRSMPCFVNYVFGISYSFTPKNQ